MNAPEQMPDWMQLLRNAVAAPGASITSVSRDLNISRTTVSLVLDEKYPARTDRIAARVIDLYTRYVCPHTSESITPADCRATASKPAPTSSPQAMRQWRACQGCAHNKERKNDSLPA